MKREFAIVKRAVHLCNINIVASTRFNRNQK